MRSGIVLAAALVMGCAWAGSGAQQGGVGAPAAGAPQAGAGAPTAFRVFEPAFLDRSVSPCENLYKFSCNGWFARHPLPADRASYGRFTELADYNDGVLRGVLEKAAAGGAGRTPNEQKIGDFYASCMDTAAIEAQGTAPVQPLLQRIAAVRDRKELPALLAELERGAARPVAEVTSSQDPHDSTREIANFDVLGLGLPDRDFYTRTDAKSAEQRKQYMAHVATMLGLIGEPATQAQADAATVLELETALAKTKLTNVEKRDPHAMDHPMSFAAFRQSVPELGMERFVQGLALPEAKLAKVNVAEPKAYAELDALLAKTDLAKLKAWLRWDVAHSYAGLSSPAALDAANFDFYLKTLRGQEVQQPRWKRCTRLVDRELGEALGEVYVRQVFPASTREDAREMARRIEAAMNQDIDDLDWMSAATKQQAKVKLKKVANKVGYPDVWRDYSRLKIVRGQMWVDQERSAAFEVQRDLGKIGKPVDKGEWGMTPPTVNAYYNPQMNDVNFPAGYLQPPFFSAKEDAAANYGDMGSTMGHELTHAFDDEGRQFDGDGNLRDWWTKEDGNKFKERAGCVVEQYSSYVPVDDLHVNGELTLGENLADIGGTLLAYIAWKEVAKAQGVDLTAKVDGYTAAQRFWIANAQQWCTQTRPESLRLQVQTDPHAPDEYRANGVVEDLPQFDEDFGCKVGSPMRPVKVCRVW